MGYIFSLFMPVIVIGVALYLIFRIINYILSKF